MMPDNDRDTIALQEAYANLYNEIVKPDRVFVATQYFRANEENKFVCQFFSYKTCSKSGPAFNQRWCYSIIFIEGL